MDALPKHDNYNINCCTFVHAYLKMALFHAFLAVSYSGMSRVTGRTWRRIFRLFACKVHSKIGQEMHSHQNLASNHIAMFLCTPLNL